MPLEINGLSYFTVPEVLASVGISRQTLWRWRQEGKTPQGHRYRDRQVLFTAAEFELIAEYANRIEPVEANGGKQLGLFNGKEDRV